MNEYYEAVKRMRELSFGDSPGDAEDWHDEADRILCEQLRRLGAHELVDLYEEVEKWYA